MSESPRAEFETDPSGLPLARASGLVGLADGEAFELRIRPVRRRIGDLSLRMLAYNDMVPGPTLVVDQGSSVMVEVVNHGDIDATVHWHGLRLENVFDGVPNYTQAPIPVGGRYRYRLSFPDEGIYWYHPHIREDYVQELGLYGNILVRPRDANYWSPAEREVVLTLDDLLIEDGRVAPFSPRQADRTAMGRFGNVFLTGGELGWAVEASVGEVVRLYLTNTANTRTFNVALPGAVMKLVGGDGGRVEDEELVEEVLISPSERAVVDVLLKTPGVLPLQHRTPDRTHDLGEVHVLDRAVGSSSEQAFWQLRHFSAMDEERRRLSYEIERSPDKHIVLAAKMFMTGHSMTDHSMPSEAPSPEHSHHSPPSESGPSHGASLPGSSRIEWEDEMAAMNQMTTPANMSWMVVDAETNASNEAINWSFKTGERVKVRIENTTASDHPMQHPIHFHGQRFLVLARDGEPTENLVWKDTVLVETGEVVDILLDASNPGRWMVHCHIAEHLESGMMFSFRVDGTA